MSVNFPLGRSALEYAFLILYHGSIVNETRPEGADNTRWTLTNTEGSTSMLATGYLSRSPHYPTSGTNVPALNQRGAVR